MRKSGFLTLGLVVGAVLSFLVLIGLYDRPAPLPADIRADRIVVHKADHKMILYKDKEVLREYPISIGRGGLAPKTREHDLLTPEGLYFITGKKLNSSYYKSLRISYPSGVDIHMAKKRKVSPGSDIMIHGIRNGLGWVSYLHRRFDWTAGCIAVTNHEMDEIMNAVEIGTPIEIMH